MGQLVECLPSKVKALGSINPSTEEKKKRKEKERRKEEGRRERGREGEERKGRERGKKKGRKEKSEVLGGSALGMTRFWT
jgi:hypothetical protein